MGYVPEYGNDVFISFTHLDNQSVTGEVGWVTDLHERLRINLDVALGREAQVWRDARLTTGTNLGSLERQILDSATILTVISPGYVNSQWCSWELQAFQNGDRRRGELWVEDAC